MKKLLGILVLGLLWCNVGFAENKLILQDLKINANVTTYFSQIDIKNYNANMEGKYGENEIYSLLYLDKERGIQEKFDDNFDIIMVAYNNNSWKIEYIAGVVENLKNCIKFRNEQAKIYKDQFKNYKKQMKTSTHDDGLKQDVISYKRGNFRAKLTCDTYPDSSPYAGTVDFRIDYLTEVFNTWVVEEEGTKSN